MKKYLLFLSSVFFLTNVSCSQNTNRSEESSSQEDTLVVKKVENLPDTVENELYDDLLDSNRPIGTPPFPLVFINGERCCDFSSDHDFFNSKEFTIKKLKAFLKKRNFIFEDVKILKDEKSLEKYRKGKYVASGAEQWIEAVYEIKARPINQKGEIFMVTARMPYFPGGDKALMAFIEKNIHHPEKMLQDSVHGKVVVFCIIEKDGSIEEYGIVNNLLKDKSGNPCTDSAIKKLCEEEALRIVRMMPRWEPGKKENGEAVRVRYNIPIIF